jgi:NAD(P) transhydrogenase subunit alpha
MRVESVGVLADRSEGERRVALVPDGARRMAKDGLTVLVEAGAGERAHHPDDAYGEAGAIVAPRTVVLEKSDVLLAVSRPPTAEIERLRAGQALIGMLDPVSDPELFRRLGSRGVVAISLERLPRTLSRAQAIDVLSSQASVGGYRAALVAAEAYDRYFPMLITAAGTSRPARVLVLGAGVAGLAAIGTARRLGAVVTGYDVRPETRGEVESLGARFLELAPVDAAAGNGYARALGEDEQRAQRAELESHLGSFDVVITTAAVPGQRPPRLISAAGLAGMGRGSVVVDAASGPDGGNVEGTVAGVRCETPGGVTLIGLAHPAADVPGAASAALSSNYSSVLSLLLRDGELRIDPGDEVHTAIVVAAPRPEGQADEPATSI